MKNNPERIQYFLYARKSSESEDRQVASIDSQIEELKSVAKREGLDVIDILSEAKTAKAPGRPIFNNMLERISKVEAQGIICWKLDRLARNPVDGGRINWMLQQGSIKHIQTYERSYYPTDNVLMMSVEFGMANQFIRDLSQNTKRGLRAKASKGWLPRNAPIGYLNNKFQERDGKAIIKDPEKFHIVKKAWNLLLEKECPVEEAYQIAVNGLGLRNKSGKKFSRSKFYEMLRNPFYYGYFHWEGVLYRGAHEPMITREEFDKAQEIMNRKSKPRAIIHDFAFTGLVRCGECGAMITAEERTKHQKNGNTHHYTYYHCTKRKNPDCSQKRITEKEIEQQIREILGNIEIPPEFHEWAMKCIKEENEKESQGHNHILEVQHKTYEGCVRKLGALIDMRANGEITEAEFMKKKSELNEEKFKLEDLLKDTGKRIDEWVERAEALFSFAETAKKRFEKGYPEDKRQILSCLGSNLFLKDGNLSVSLQKPLLLMKEYAEGVRSIHERFEPVKNRMDKEDFEALYTQNPLWGG